MSSVKQIQLNYNNGAGYLTQSAPKYNSAQSFKGGASSDVAKEIANEAAKRIQKDLHPVQKFINWASMKMNATAGEIQNQLVTAVFTTTLAPLMIAYNPFSKSDEKTKKYSALRQPISAGIALSAGLGMTLGINKFMDIMGSEGHLPYIDGRMEPSAEYLKGQFKKEKGIKSPFLNKAQKAELKTYVEDVQKARKELFTALIGEDPKNIKINDKKQILINGKKIAENIPGMETKEQIEKYIKENNLHQRKISDFMEKTFKFEFYEDKTFKPSITDAKLKDVKALDFLKELGIIGEKTQVDGMKKFDGKDLAKVLGAGEDASKMTLGELLEHLKLLDKVNPDMKVKDVSMIREKQLQSLMNKNMSELLDKIAKPFKENAGKIFNPKAGLKEFAANITSGKIAKLSKNFKNYKNFTGIFFNFFTTMISCSILNWAYPRIIEKFFPELLKKDSPKQQEVQKGGNK